MSEELPVINESTEIDETPTPPERVVIVRATERFPFKYADTTFWYRRLTARKNREFIAAATTNGELDSNKLGDMILRYCIVGWDDLDDGVGGVIPTIDGLSDDALDARWEIIQDVPDQALIRMAPRFREALPDRSALGN